MLSVPADLPVFLAVEPVDMRRSFDGLAIHVQSYLSMNPLTDGLFIFRNKAGDKVKLMWWQKNGLVITYKRLEQGRFKCPKPPNKMMTLTRQELEFLLDGIHQFITFTLKLRMHAGPRSIFSTGTQASSHSILILTR